MCKCGWLPLSLKFRVDADAPRSNLCCSLVVVCSPGSTALEINHLCFHYSLRRCFFFFDMVVMLKCPKYPRFIHSHLLALSILARMNFGGRSKPINDFVREHFVHSYSCSINQRPLSSLHYP